MNRHSFLNITATIVAAILTVTSSSQALHAQEVDHRAKANVPFGFEVGSRHFNPGIYNIVLQRDNLISIQSGSNAALAVIRWDTGRKASPNGKLVFHKYGDKYFLSEVWTPGDPTHLQCVLTAAEAKVKKAQLTASVTYNSNVELALMQTSK